eukprot:CAMPEP_0203766158 /NCGR_PEP_ID=MMETSP0099_2-20121227/257_1 /ASSEMBLY_ACC=CAM_ASM_000209 /TAXON_ID=96639 /ORGANISM=" , Strain NY0313808BC1" /LENGTH=150 /DNA_ID=CAMNT_0050662467 /DNA_START=695 /DNA_END=1146 /DNA_ORIENTATION=-
MISAQAQGGKQDVVYAEPIAVSNVQVIQPTGAAPTQPVVAQAYNPSVNNGQYQQQPLQQHYQQQPPQQQYNQQPVYVSQPVKAPQPPPQVVVVQGAATPNPYAVLLWFESDARILSSIRHADSGFYHPTYLLLAALLDSVLYAVLLDQRI